MVGALSDQHRHAGVLRVAENGLLPVNRDDPPVLHSVGHDDVA